MIDSLVLTGSEEEQHFSSIQLCQLLAIELLLLCVSSTE